MKAEKANYAGYYKWFTLIRDIWNTHKNGKFFRGIYTKCPQYKFDKFTSLGFRICKKECE